MLMPWPPDDEEESWEDEVLSEEVEDSAEVSAPWPSWRGKKSILRVVLCLVMTGLRTGENIELESRLYQQVDVESKSSVWGQQASGAPSSVCSRIYRCLPAWRLSPLYHR